MQSERTSFHFGVVPALREDELLYSWLGRLIKRNSLAPPRTAVALLLGGAYRTLSPDLPTGIDSLQSGLGSQSPVGTSLEWIDKATLYPYHRPFLDPRRDQIITTWLRAPERHGHRIKTLIGRVANRFGAYPYFRYCPSCAAEDFSRWEASYWRRTWLLPGVSVCPIHRAALAIHAVPVRPTNPFAPYQLRDAPQDLGSIALPTLGLQQFCALSRDLLHANLPALLGGSLVNCYRQRARAMGYRSRGQAVGLRKLACGIREHYNDFEGFEHRERLLSTAARPLAWLHTIFERPERSLHPACHLILIGHLFGSIAQWMDAVLNGQLADAAAPAVPPRVALLPSTDRRAFIGAPELLDTNLSCRTAANVLGIDVGTVAAHRRANGIAVSIRSHRRTRMLEEEVAKALSQGDPLEAIALRFKVSLATVCRILRANPRLARDREECIANRRSSQAKAVWLATLARERSVTAARRCASAAYAWLYRQDRAWLQQANSASLASAVRSPTRSNRVDWPKRDIALRDRIVEMNSEWLASGALQRRSRSRFLRVLRAGKLMARQAAKLPLAHQALDSLAETEHAWRERRLLVAASALEQSGNPLSLVRLIRAAHINWSFREDVQRWLVEFQSRREFTQPKTFPTDEV